MITSSFVQWYYMRKSKKLEQIVQRIWDLYTVKFVLFDLDDGSLYIASVVNYGVRGVGNGTMAMSMLKQWARDNGYEYIELTATAPETDPRGVEGIVHWYEKNGFSRRYGTYMSLKL